MTPKNKLRSKQPDSKNFLFVSRYGESLDIAFAVQNEGHKVRMYIEESGCREIGLGFIKRTTNWEKHTDWADIIVFDYTGYGEESKALKDSGKLVFGGNTYTDNLELDRNFGQEELKRHGIKILPSREFQTFEEAIQFIRKHPDCYVMKPSGETQELKQLLFVGQDDEGADVIRILQAYERSWGNDFGTFQLQKKVKGVEISVSGYFNGKDFIKPLNITFEHKKLFPKELGVSTGEMGSSMFWTKDSPIFDATLAKFTPTLREHGFIGHIDLNCIVNGNGIYPLEFTSRFGFPQVFIQRAGINEEFGQFLLKVARGENFTINVKKGFQVGAFIVVPPFPYEDKKTFRLFSKDAVVVFKKDKKEGVHPMHVKRINNEWLITGDTGIAVLVTGTGVTMKDAQRMMQNRISNVIVNNGYYRTDIGDRWHEDSDRLWSWGLL
ncbi:phosphoribosylamine--glycine ligase [Robertkochia marina]|uniref:phosphoribosylamine--glycine ligase n=1 Tax=Robertkochia marina TaxID=1227945 RepID=A0A4V3UYI1_9FLAO|nr:phosphoribosylamine--glycine ligase [Robertkochia marina]THD69808.1 phosphoribosylamine--glycine ligase [Robertkochia marina]TRZ46848.1 phosphoribosylamine--glycine ligase [Robertkochia marina]